MLPLLMYLCFANKNTKIITKNDVFVEMHGVVKQYLNLYLT